MKNALFDTVTCGHSILCLLYSCLSLFVSGCHVTKTSFMKQKVIPVHHCIVPLCSSFDVLYSVINWLGQF
jgi:hypothetical protein